MQNQLISSKIYPENIHKIRHFLQIAFGKVCPEKSLEIPAKLADFSVIRLGKQILPKQNNPVTHLRPPLWTALKYILCYKGPL